jgi:hypothetical protein
MTPGLAMFLFAVVTLVVAAVTFAVAEHLATNQDPTRCAPDCPACPENHPPISEWDIPEFEHDSVQLAADNSVQTDPQ